MCVCVRRRGRNVYLVWLRKGTSGGRPGRFVAGEPSVGAGARDAVNIEKVEQVANNFSPQVDSSLNSAFRHALHGLLDESNSPHVVSV